MSHIDNKHMRILPTSREASEQDTSPQGSLDGVSVRALECTLSPLQERRASLMIYSQSGAFQARKAYFNNEGSIFSSLQKALLTQEPGTLTESRLTPYGGGRGKFSASEPTADNRGVNPALTDILNASSLDISRRSMRLDESVYNYTQNTDHLVISANYSTDQQTYDYFWPSRITIDFSREEILSLGESGDSLINNVTQLSDQILSKNDCILATTNHRPGSSALYIGGRYSLPPELSSFQIFEDLKSLAKNPANNRHLQAALNNLLSGKPVTVFFNTPDNLKGAVTIKYNHSLAPLRSYSIPMLMDSSAVIADKRDYLSNPLTIEVLEDTSATESVSDAAQTDSLNSIPLNSNIEDLRKLYNAIYPRKRELLSSAEKMQGKIASSSMQDSNPLSEPTTLSDSVKLLLSAFEDADSTVERQTGCINNLALELRNKDEGEFIKILESEIANNNAVTEDTLERIIIGIRGRMEESLDPSSARSVSSPEKKQATGPESKRGVSNAGDVIANSPLATATNEETASLSSNAVDALQNKDNRVENKQDKPEQIHENGAFKKIALGLISFFTSLAQFSLAIIGTVTVLPAIIYWAKTGSFLLTDFMRHGFNSLTDSAFNFFGGSRDLPSKE